MDKGPTLYAGGLVFDGLEAPQAGLGVLVDKGRIEAVKPVAAFEGFAGERVDTRGATLMPGLMDCHIHICYGAEGNPGDAAEKLTLSALTLKAMDNARKILEGGVVAVRDCGGKDYVDLDVRDALNAGRFPGPVMRASGKMICMTGGHGNKNGIVADGCDEVIKAVRTNVHKGADVIKIMATGGVMTPGVNPEDAHYSAEEMAAGISEAKRFNKRTASHAQGAEGILNAVRGGIHSIEHGIFMNEECIREMIERGVFLVPTLAAVKNIIANRDRGIPAWAVEKSERVYDIHIAAFRAYQAAGGKVAMGTDAGTPFNQHGENAQELAHMVEAGMSRLDALIAGTSNAAELIEPGERGRVAEGLVADLLLVRGNPAEDIAMAAERANHLMVIKDGRTFADRRAGAEMAQAAE
ncbi:MAG: aryldialkylphosphatase [Rhizobiales bacterium NRL2]|jgi:imidazolonepropionase-like amidohydrolase|nr:MAG: aryldialkylphosphatase [Rhizobiales bacterium NRL2]